MPFGSTVRINWNGTVQIQYSVDKLLYARETYNNNKSIGLAIMHMHFGQMFHPKMLAIIANKERIHAPIFSFACVGYYDRCVLTHMMYVCPASLLGYMLSVQCVPAPNSSNALKLTIENSMPMEMVFS